MRISDWSSDVCSSDLEGRALLFAPIVNYLDYDLSACRAMIGDPNALFGLGDGGAHVGFITDASFPSFLLSHWGRDADDRLDVAELIRRLTRANAEAAGLFDRGDRKGGV